MDDSNPYRPSREAEEEPTEVKSETPPPDVIATVTLTVLIAVVIVGLSIGFVLTLSF